MAIVRCAQCGVEQPGSGRWTHNYVRRVTPVGTGLTAIICGKSSCERPGLIWLEEHEVAEYNRGIRIFGLLRNRAKVRAA